MGLRVWVVNIATNAEHPQITDLASEAAENVQRGHVAYSFKSRSAGGDHLQD